MSIVAILQPNYIPWKGVFDLIDRTDTFVFYDDVQYTTKDWRNRNKIKTDTGEQWLSVPVISKSQRNQLICEAIIDKTKTWQKKHYKKIISNYQKAHYFDNYKHLLHKIYLDNQWSKISNLDIFSTKLIAKELNIKTEWVNSSDLRISGSKHGEKIIKICQELNCSHFINGPASKSFIDESIFKQAGITIEYMNYSYPEYKQFHPPFSHNVTALDTLFHCGPESRKFICMKQT